MSALNTIKSTKIESSQYVNIFFRKTPFALVITNNKIQQVATHAKLET